MEEVQGKQDGNPSTCDDVHLWVEKYDNTLLEEIAEALSRITPYEPDECNKLKVSTELNTALQGFINVVIRDKPMSKKKLEALCGSLFSHTDLYMLIIRRLFKHVSKLSTVAQYWNFFYCLRFLPIPEKKLPFFFNTKVGFARAGSKNRKLRRLYQNAWLEFVKIELPTQLLKELVPYLCEDSLQVMPDGYLFGDFLFRVFQMNDVFAVLALEGIFKLMSHYNFEYPNFYSSLYKLTVPSVCYMDNKKKFLELLDTFLSSTHLPTYIVAAFIKRLCRLALIAPLTFQEPLLSLIRNLTTRHEGVRPLLHREEPKVLDNDPYDEKEDDMQKCGAVESSLWEIQAIQKHWCASVARRANFTDKGIQTIESFIRWKTYDEYFTEMLSEKYGGETVNNDNGKKWSYASDEENDGIEEENLRENLEAVENEPKRKRKRRDDSKLGDSKSYEVLINPLIPSGEFFSNKFQLPMNEYWKF